MSKNQSQISKMDGLKQIITTQVLTIERQCDETANYFVGDLSYAYAEQSGWIELTETTNGNNGIHRKGDSYFYIFHTCEDGSYPIYEADEIENPELILGDYLDQFEGLAPYDNLPSDCANIGIIPVSLSTKGIDELKENGLIIDFAAYLDLQEAGTDKVSVYSSINGIYFLDMFIAVGDAVRKLEESK